MVSLMNKNALNQTRMGVDVEGQPNEKDEDGVD